MEHWQWWGIVSMGVSWWLKKGCRQLGEDPCLSSFTVSCSACPLQSLGW